MYSLAICTYQESNESGKISESGKRPGAPVSVCACIHQHETDLAAALAISLIPLIQHFSFRISIGSSNKMNHWSMINSYSDQ